jgi:uncharacterized membrane protein YdbT with pleckstrin-like domain
VDEKFIAIRHASKKRPKFWFYTIFSLGIWLIWWRNNYLALTERSIIRRKGVFNKEERAVPLNQVQDISISHGIVRRILGHGDISIDTAGSDATEVVMQYADAPEEFRSLVFAQIDKFYGDGVHPQPEKPKNE